MKIGNTGSSPNIQPEVPLRKTTAYDTQQTRHDSVRTSARALALSRSAAELKARLQPRPEVLKKFAAVADTDLELDDATIDQIIDRMQSP